METKVFAECMYSFNFGQHHLIKIYTTSIMTTKENL